MESVQKTVRHWVQKIRPQLKLLPVRIGLFLVIAVAIFSFGLGVGNGTIRFTQFSSMTGLPSNLNYSSVNQLYHALRSNYDGSLNQQQLLDGIKTGLINATGDVHTEYFNAKDAQAFNNELQGMFSGIGAELGKNASGEPIVISPIEGSPAAAAGLKAQDIIAQVNGKSTVNESIDQVVNTIRGPQNTKVTLSIQRGQDQLSFTITRQNITIPSVNHKILDGNIGYMQISQFSDDTASLAAKAAEEFSSKNVKGIILDLRGNPGGEVDAAVGVCSLWLPQGTPIMQERRGSQVVTSYTAIGTQVIQRTTPTVILIDGGSASAAEITAGALKDANVATLVGVKSYGKGSVQQIFSLSGGTEAKITVARWYRPNGDNIDKKGITPDQIVTLTSDDFANGNDTQLNAAIAKINGQ